MKLTLGHTPDTDDAFMLYALLKGRVDTEGLEFREVLEPIAALNRRAAAGELDVTALSVAALPGAVAYLVLPCGACMGTGHGPLLVARDRTVTVPPDTRENREWRRGEYANERGLQWRMSRAGSGMDLLGVPGLDTTACLAARFVRQDLRPVAMAFDEILPAVVRGDVAAGVLISEDQARVNEFEFEVKDLGCIWEELLAAPLVLGVDAAHERLRPDVQHAVARVFRRSIRFALANPDEALADAMRFCRGLDAGSVKRFVLNYVGEHTVDMGDAGRRSISRFLDRCHAAHLASECTVRFLDADEEAGEAAS